MRKKIILLALALIAGTVLFSFSFFIAKKIEKNKQQEQEKRIIRHKEKVVKSVNQKEPSNVLKDKRLKKINQDTNLKQNTNINQPEKIDYSGEITKEANGWKKYRNEYWGIEFRFRDFEDKINIRESSDRITLYKGDPCIYIISVL